MERYFVCKGGGPHKGPVGIHHINGNPNDNRLENLMPLCQACHMREHGKMIAKRQFEEHCMTIMVYLNKNVNHISHLEKETGLYYARIKDILSRLEKEGLVKKEYLKETNGHLSRWPGWVLTEDGVKAFRLKPGGLARSCLRQAS